jgi:hypothetical protein
MSEYVFIAPRRFQCGEAEWKLIYEEWVKTGKVVRPTRIKAMFPEQFPPDSQK